MPRPGAATGVTPTPATGAHRLVVKVARAENVWAKSRGNVSDPYCILNVGPATARTKIINNTLNPEWEETLILPFDRMHR